MIWIAALVVLACVWWLSDINELWTLVVAVPLVLALI